MSEKYAIENDFAAQKEMGERERDMNERRIGKLINEIELLKAKLSVTEKEASEFKKVLEEIEKLYLDAEGPIIDGGEMGRKAHYVLERERKRILWPYDEENKNG